MTTGLAEPAVPARPKPRRRKCVRSVLRSIGGWAFVALVRSKFPDAPITCRVSPCLADERASEAFAGELARADLP